MFIFITFARNQIHEREDEENNFPILGMTRTDTTNIDLEITSRAMKLHTLL